ncbi:hypothetical protein B7494_g1555 [Chlorociboria aeruginascens]|nr:hypothetical protein B7494_g1555 [Chlorociboria aeruginascens]
MASSSATQDHIQPSKNPYRQHQLVQAEPITLEAFEFDALEKRKFTPARAVFDDLHTAHSSITSGSARSKRGTSNNTTEDHGNEDDSIPLKDLGTARALANSDFLHNLPLPPPPVVVFHGRYHDDGSENLLSIQKGNTSEQSTSVEIGGISDSPAYNIKNALASSSSPITPDSRARNLALPRWFLDAVSQRDKVKPLELDPYAKDCDIGPSTPLSQASKDNRKRDTSSCQHDPDSTSIYKSSTVHTFGSLPGTSREYGDGDHVSGLHPRDLDREKYDSHYENDQVKGAQASSEGTTKNRTLPNLLSKNHSGGNDTVSLRESSTVGRIYTHYARSNDDNYQSENSDGELDDSPSVRAQALHGPMTRQFPELSFELSSRSLSSERTKLSALNVRKQRRADRSRAESKGQPPRFSLPNTPNFSAHGTPLSVSPGVGTSSSYGETKNLLELTQRTQLTGPKASGNLSRERNLLVDQAVPNTDISSESQLKPNNTFSLAVPPLLLVSQAPSTPSVHGDGNGRNNNYIMEDRQPLERDVSEALRRASGYSTYTIGTRPSSDIERRGDFQSERSDSRARLVRSLTIEDTPPSGPDSVDGDLITQAQMFYDQGAIPSNWINSGRSNMVRVPINHNGSYPDSPPDSQVDELEQTDKVAGSRKRLEDEDVNDWETVGESALGKGGHSNKIATGLLGGNVNRAGSSLANTSDEGTTTSTATNTIPEIDEYDSSERIAQHPGNIQYLGDYRQRDVKKSHVPVFLPIFREHKVNGYLADSNRTRPPVTPSSYVPQPLARSHTNPFKSSPPEILTSSGALPSKYRTLVSKAPNHFPSSTKALNTTLEGDSTGKENAPEPYTQTQPTEHLSGASNWMDYYGEPGPVVNNQFLQPGAHGRPSSWQHIKLLANESDAPEYNLDGTRIYKLGSANPDTAKKDAKLLTIPNEGFVEVQTSGKGKGLANIRELTPLVENFPGGLNHGLRTERDQKRSSWSNDRERPVRISSRHSSTNDYPTNALRPLSLVAKHGKYQPNMQQPSAPTVDHFRRPSQNTHPHNFVYRSPLAPPKRGSWQKLYSKSQLHIIQSAARADGFFESHTPQANGLSQKEGSSQKHLSESPRLFTWTRESSTRNSLAKRKRNISIFVLCLCNLCPPLLFLRVAEGQNVPANSAQGRADKEKKASEPEVASESAVEKKTTSAKTSKRKTKDTSTSMAMEATEKFMQNLPSVPSTNHIAPGQICASSFFSLHRPISLTHSYPKTITNDAFAAIFRPRTKSNTDEVISTLSSTIQSLSPGKERSHLRALKEEEWNPQTDEFRAAITAESYRKAETQHLDNIPLDAAMQFQGHAISTKYMPFNPPAAPVPKNTAESLLAGAEAAQQEPQTRTYTTVLTIQESTDSNGEVSYVTQTSPFVVEDSPTKAYTPYKDRMQIRRQQFEEREQRQEMFAISVKRQRKLKMKKHKYKKLMRRTRNLRRRLDRN